MKNEIQENMDEELIRLRAQVNDLSYLVRMLVQKIDNGVDTAKTAMAYLHKEKLDVTRPAGSSRANTKIKSINRQHTCEKIFHVIASSKANGLLKSEITNRTPGLTSRARNEMLDELIEGARVWIKDAPTTKAGGRPGKRYYANTMGDDR